jgi:hypothetical protein
VAFLHGLQVCGELAGMLQAVDDFRQFLGPELKAVMGDSSVIDEVSVMVQVGPQFHKVAGNLLFCRLFARM